MVLAHKWKNRTFGENSKKFRIFRKWNKKFETLFGFIEQENLDLPNMFFFITRIEKDGNEKSIIDLKDKYRKYINLIEDN